VTASILHFLAGVLVGSVFRVRTLLVLIFAVLVEALVAAAVLGLSIGLIWLIVSQIALQLGYLGGMYLRSVLERIGIVVDAGAPQRRRS
jgi:hypothetical protein